MRTLLRTLFVLLTVVTVAFAPSFAFAGTGTIDPAIKYSQLRDLDIDSDSVNDRINWKPTQGNGVVITDTLVTGDIWGESLGWIRLNPANCTGCGVTNTTGGVLGGYAWGENTGWISFNCANGSQCSNNGNYGVTINTTNGQFSGNAWSQNYGWIKFDCSSSDSCVTTDWRPTTGGGGGGGGGNTGGGGSLPTPSCSLIASNLQINQGGSTLLQWTLYNTGTIDIGSGVGIKSGNSSLSVSPQQTTTYIGSVHNPYGTASCSITVVVNSTQPQPTSTLPIPVQMSDLLDTLVTEGGTAQLSLRPLSTPQDPITLVITTQNGSATAPADFNAITRTFTWAPGDTRSQTFSVSTVDDQIIEGGEHFNVSVTSIQGAYINRSVARVEIDDNDVNPNSPGVIAFSRPFLSQFENVSAGSVAIRRDGGSQGRVEVDVQLVAGIDTPGATVGDDIRDLGTYTVVWQDGEFGAKTINFELIDDRREEGNEYINLSIVGNRGNATIGAVPSVRLEIQDDEMPMMPTTPTSTTSTTPGGDQGGRGVSGIPNLPLWPALAGIGLLGIAASIALQGSRIGQYLAGLFGFYKTHRPWGVVYDSRTKQPLDPAYVSLIKHEAGEEIASAITDLDGRYGFLVKEPGMYRLTANKTHYAFPSAMLAGTTRDELYTDLYFGEVFEIKEAGQVIVKNIPLDSVEADWNEQAKKDGRVTRFFKKHDRLLVWLANMLFAAGLVSSVVAIIVTQSIWNIVVICLYGLLVIVFILGFRPRSHGSLSLHGKPLPFGIIRVFNAKLHKEVAHAVADEFGKYFLLMPKGTYYLTVEARNPDTTYEHVYTSPVMNVKRGILNKSIKI